MQERVGDQHGHSWISDIVHQHLALPLERDGVLRQINFASHGNIGVGSAG